MRDMFNETLLTVFGIHGMVCLFHSKESSFDHMIGSKHAICEVFKRADTELRILPHGC